MASFWGTVPNLNRAVNMLNRGVSLLDVLAGTADAVAEGLSELANGLGYTAASPKVENAVLWATTKARSGKVTYSQDNRNLNNPDAKSYDCSSFIITAFNQAGFNISASTTYDMKAGFTAKGFKWIPGSRFTSSQLQRGDILLNEEHHTQMYIGSNQDVNCGATPAKVQAHNSYYNHNGATGWDGVLRYIPKSTKVTVPSNVSQTGIVADYTANYGTRGWASGTSQKKLFNLWNAQSSTYKYSDGIATYKSRYLVALRPVFGKVGDIVNIVLADNVVISAIMADEKGSDAGSKWGHVMDGKVSVVEFEAKTDLSLSDIRYEWRNQKVKYIENYGSVW